jgi:hypothetical protein
VLKQLFLIDTSSGWDNLSSELTEAPPEYSAISSLTAKQPGKGLIAKIPPALK